MIEIKEEADEMAENEKTEEKMPKNETPDQDKEKEPDIKETEEQSEKSTEKEADTSQKKSKKKPLQKKKPDPRDEKIKELEDKVLRSLAEFENFRNRSEKEKAASFDMGAKSVIEKILPVVDSFERGLEGLSDEEKESPFAKGIEAVYKQMMSSLSEAGVTPIEAVGQTFDPNLHSAMMHEEDDSGEESKVVQEFQKGYMYKETVVRYSMVKVLN